MSTTTGPLDQAQIEMLLSLDDGAGGVLGEIVGEYLAMAEAGRIDLFGALGQHDAHGVARAAHSLKGASANVGAEHLAEVCADIERFARADELGDIGASFGQFESEFARVMDALRELPAEH